MGRSHAAFSRLSVIFVRAGLTVFFTVALLNLWACNTGRGFLPQMRRFVMLEMQPDANGVWAVAAARDAPGDSPDFPPLNDGRSVGIVIQESSMGRTHHGLFSEWRASHWDVISVSIGLDGWRSAFGKRNAIDPAVNASIVKAVESKVIPNSPPSKVWPGVPLVPEQHQPLSWTAWQHRTSWSVVVMVPSICLALGCFFASCCAEVMKTWWPGITGERKVDESRQL